MLRMLLAEPPLRRVAQLAAYYLPCALRTKARWDAATRAHYLTGLLYAADEARRQGHPAVAAVEFGVAEGYGLLALQRHAAAVEQATGVRVAVYGFDTGVGLPPGTGDYRDHPDHWQRGDYVMDVAALRRQLTARTTLVLGPIRDTVPRQAIPEPLGFIAVDVDFYSSTVDCLALLQRGDVPRLRRVAMYFDDVDLTWSHRRAGELLAIEAFNAAHADIVIDRWRGLRAGRAFPEAPWLDAMYLAHDLVAISATHLTRGAARMR